MQKIPTLYLRDPATHYVTDQVNPGCEWVLAGEGFPTRKYNGTCVMLDEYGHWWARREVKPGKQPPPNYVPIETDLATGKTVGWEPIEQSPFRAAHAEAVAVVVEFGKFIRKPPPLGTYELIGPMINGNPERATAHRLERHAVAETIGVLDEGGASVANPDPADVIALCREWGWEGTVWHHPDGRMAKLKVRDYPPRDGAA